MIPREQFDAYNRAVANLSDGAQREIESGIWAWLQTDEGRAASVAECREYAKGVMSGVIQRYDEAAGSLAAEWYDRQAADSHVKLPSAITATTYDQKTVDETARYQAKRLAKGDLRGFAKYCGELGRNDVLRSLNETIIQNVGRDKRTGVRFARVPTGAETCTFCLMLASRGAVYHTRKTAGEFRHFHRKCDCKVVMGFEDDSDAELVEGVHPEELRDQWWQMEKIDAAEGLSGVERDELKRNVIDGVELPEAVRKVNPTAHMRKAGHGSSGWISASKRLNAELKAHGYDSATEFYDYLSSRKTRAETAEAIKLAEEVLRNADATPKLYDVARSHLRPSIEANLTQGEIAAREVAPTSSEVPNWLDGAKRNIYAKKHAAAYGIDYRSKAGQDEYDRIMSEVMDSAYAVEFVNDITGQRGQRCAVYFRSEDIAVVNLERNVRVTLFKRDKGRSRYYDALWDKVHGGPEP